jgi:hypothetical protein
MFKLLHGFSTSSAVKSTETTGLIINFQIKKSHFAVLTHVEIQSIIYFIKFMNLYMNKRIWRCATYIFILPYFINFVEWSFINEKLF